jgi:rubrerythrin
VTRSTAADKKRLREEHRRKHPSFDVPGCRRCSGVRAFANYDFSTRQRGTLPNAWTEAEDRRFAELLGRFTPIEIAEILNAEFHRLDGVKRNENAVVTHTKHTGRSRRMTGIRLHEVEAIFQFDHRGIHREWLEPGLLVPERTYPGRGATKFNYVFTEAELERFVREHHTAYDYRRIDPDRVNRWPNRGESHVFYTGEIVDLARRLRRLAEQTWAADPYLTRDEFLAYMGWKSDQPWQRWALDRQMVPFVRRRHSIRLGAASDGEILIRAADAPAIKERIEQARKARRSTGAKQRIERYGPSTAGKKLAPRPYIRTHTCVVCSYVIIRKQSLPVNCPECGEVAWHPDQLDSLVIRQRGHGGAMVVGGY